MSAAIITHSPALSMDEAFVDCQEHWTVAVITTLDVVFLKITLYLLIYMKNSNLSNNKRANIFLKRKKEI